MNLSIIIRIMPSGEEYEVEMPEYFTGKDIVEQLLDGGYAPKSDPGGNPYAYDLIIKSKNMHLQKEKSLSDLGVNDGDTILFVPNLVPG